MLYLKEGSKLLAEEQLRLITVTSFPQLKEPARRKILQDLTAQVEQPNYRAAQDQIDSNWDQLRALKGRIKDGI